LTIYAETEKSIPWNDGAIFASDIGDGQIQANERNKHPLMAEGIDIELRLPRGMLRI
jgi:hypothetical protein